MSRKLFSMALLAGMALLGASCSDDETTNNDGGIADGTTLSGTITEDVTLKSGNTYKLSGAYTVEEGATLNIEPGVKIVAVYDDNVDYILIKQGAKINAKGTASAPIIMTSEKEESGVFQNWAQYRLTMKYLATMTDRQTLVMYSGHPLGLFPSHENAPRVVVTNGMVIPNYSKPDDWERFNALGVSQYGQMTAGSYMYIGPQGIVHGTTITVLNAAHKQEGSYNAPIAGKLFVSAGLGGMSGAQPKAAVIAGV